MTGKKAARARDYIEHILEAIARIETYVADIDQSEFLRNLLVQDAVIRNFEVIGEAANKLHAANPAFARQYPHLRLDLAYRMRNALIHGYDSVNLSIVWNTVQNDVPTLKQHMAVALRDLASQPPEGKT